MTPRNAREQRQWSQQELARRSGLHASTISTIEKGFYVPSESQIEKLARALGVSPEELDVPRRRRTQQERADAGESARR